MRVEFAGGTAYMFSFSGVDSEIKANAVKTQLEKQESENDIALESLETEKLKRIVQLKDSSLLQEFFEDLVIKNKKMSEEEFWQSFND